MTLHVFILSNNMEAPTLGTKVSNSSPIAGLFHNQGRSKSHEDVIK